MKATLDPRRAKTADNKLQIWWVRWDVKVKRGAPLSLIKGSSLPTTSKARAEQIMAHLAAKGYHQPELMTGFTGFLTEPRPMVRQRGNDQ